MSEKNLCTLDDIRKYYDLGPKAEDDRLIEKLIERISEFFCKYCNKTNFLQTTYTEITDGNDTRNIFVDNHPIKSITSINIDAGWSFGSSTVIDSDNYQISNNGLYIMTKFTVPSGLGNIKIVYSAGFSDIPEDVRQACVEEVIRKFKSRDTFDVTSRTLPDGSVSYVEKGLLKNTIEVLSRYKTWGCV